jgi:hypothetical protein
MVVGNSAGHLSVRWSRASPVVVAHAALRLNEPAGAGVGPGLPPNSMLR